MCMETNRQFGIDCIPVREKETTGRTLAGGEEPFLISWLDGMKLTGIVAKGEVSPDFMKK